MSAHSMSSCGRLAQRPALPAQRRRTAARVAAQAAPQPQQPQRKALAAPAPAIGRWTGLNAGPAAPQRFSPDSVLPLVTTAVESEAQMASFEAFAGRSAMVGFMVALALECATDTSTFSSLAPAQAEALAAVAAACLAAGAGLAALAARREAVAAAAAPLMEAVNSSLTGNRRSASGVTQVAVDDVVDFVVDRLITPATHPVFGESDAPSSPRQ